MQKLGRGERLSIGKLSKRKQYWQKLRLSPVVGKDFLREVFQPSIWGSIILLELPIRALPISRFRRTLSVNLYIFPVATCHVLPEHPVLGFPVRRLCGTSAPCFYGLLSLHCAGNRIEANWNTSTARILVVFFLLCQLSPGNSRHKTGFATRNIIWCFVRSSKPQTWFKIVTYFLVVSNWSPQTGFRIEECRLLGCYVVRLL
jgi:hypothetical protein